MEHLAGQTLVKKSKEEISADEALNEKELIGFYFSAHWCPPCRRFTPILADFYQEVKDAGFPFEIVFVSSDDSEEALFSYMDEVHGDWLAVPYGSPIVDPLKEKFEIDGIPFLAIVKKDGSVVVKDATEEVENKGLQAYKEWAQ